MINSIKEKYQIPIWQTSGIPAEENDRRHKVCLVFALFHMVSGGNHPIPVSNIYPSAGSLSDNERAHRRSSRRYLVPLDYVLLEYIHASNYPHPRQAPLTMNKQWILFLASLHSRHTLYPILAHRPAAFIGSRCCRLPPAITSRS